MPRHPVVHGRVGRRRPCWLHVDREAARRAGDAGACGRGSPSWPRRARRRGASGCACTQPPAQTVLARVDDVPGFGWQAWTPAAVDRRAAGGRGRRPDTRARQRARHRRRRPRRRHVLDRRPRRARPAGRRRRRRRHLQLVPARRRRPLVDEPQDGHHVGGRRPGPLRGRIADRAARYPLAGRSPDRRSTSRRPRAARRRDARAGARTSSTTTAARPPAPGVASRCPTPASHVRGRVRVRHRRARARRRGRADRAGPADVPVPPVRAGRRAHGRARGPARVRAGRRRRRRRAHALALTLLRCTGMLSQGPMATRPLPAGPMTPMEGPQMQKRVAVRYGICVGDGRPVRAGRRRVRAAARGGGGRPHGADCRAGAVGHRRRGVRRGAPRRRWTPAPPGLQPHATPTTVTIEGRRGWLVDLRGRPLEPFEETFPLGPCAIATAVLQ